MSSQTRRSALFVDFDNLYLGLCKIDPRAGKDFGSNPGAWLRRIQSWTPDEHNPDANVEHRTLLARYCYLNPLGRGARYRHALLSVGFHIIECLPVTQQGKNCADMRIVIDALDLLGHRTHFDEFILLSGDADFLPLLVRLREHDRRTFVAFSGHAASAYRAAADIVLDASVLVPSALANPGRAGTPDKKDDSFAAVLVSAA